MINKSVENEVSVTIHLNDKTVFNFFLVQTFQFFHTFIHIAFKEEIFPIRKFHKLGKLHSANKFPRNILLFNTFEFQLILSIFCFGKALKTSRENFFIHKEDINMNDSQNSIQSKKLDPKDVAKLRVLDALENESLNFAQFFVT